eukprot:TRINITY_DN4326_c0_g1_i1.p1 TRINITY_DN4326_c0_g1~~TRINITY_DN4326_c0_g1_i1.p1  ORF type:complete len:111 (+),score=27.65 TRINITY_DN4326_c0_g1_i1:48-335(+)
MGSSLRIMRAAILLAVVAVATGAPKFSKKGLSTLLSRGGGEELLVGNVEGLLPRRNYLPPRLSLLRRRWLVGVPRCVAGSLVALDNGWLLAGRLL